MGRWTPLVLMAGGVAILLGTLLGINFPMGGQQNANVPSGRKSSVLPANINVNSTASRQEPETTSNTEPETSNTTGNETTEGNTSRRVAQSNATTESPNTESTPSSTTTEENNSTEPATTTSTNEGTGSSEREKQPIRALW